MIAVDSSVAVAGFGEWHVLHAAAKSVLDDGVSMPAHAYLETFSVLTGFPPPHRAAPSLVHEWLRDRFDALLAPPPASAHRTLVRDLASAGRAGGSVYDALVGLTAKRAGATLVTADRRAAALYAAVGTAYELLT